MLHDGPDDPASRLWSDVQPNRPWPDFADEGVQTVLEGVIVSGEHPNATAYRQTADAFRSGDQPARLWSMST